MNAGELSEKLTFGKYKGKTVADVLVEDPSYIVWAHENVDFFKVSTEIYQIAVVAKEDQEWAEAEAYSPYDKYD